MTSHDVVSFLRRQFKIKKIGHAGTLDPQAAGVLPLCIGQATRLVEFLTSDDKEYFCEMRLGLTTTTQDAWGEVIRSNDYSQITLDEITKLIPQFTGEITQLTPAYSAVKIQGIPLYKRARLGMEIQPHPRQVFIYKLEIVKFEPPRLTFLVKCSKGTYVRTICHDLGEALGVGGHLSFLLRTRVGNFTLAESVTLEEVVALKEKALLPLESCIQELTQIVLTEKEIQKIKQGQLLYLHKPITAKLITDKTKFQHDKSNEAISHEEVLHEAISSTVGSRLHDTIQLKSISAIKEAAVLNEKGKLQAIVVILKNKNELILKPKKVFNRE